MLVSVDQLVGKAFGTYHLKQLLGQGSLSAVYAGKQYESERAVMLTLFILPPACVGRARERFMERFTHEASALTRLNHPNIVPVYDFGEQSGYPYLVTPLTEGGSLASVLKQQSRCTPAQVLLYLKQIAAGLDYAHNSGVVHGGLKLSNIMLDSEQKVQIAGFGLARMLEMRGIGHIGHSHPHLFSVAGTLLSSPAYVAPEVVQGAPADARADVYSLGIVLFELLAGRPPFTGTDPVQVSLQHVEQRMPSLQATCPDIPAALDLALQRALERDPTHRVSSAGKLAVAFERVMNVIQSSPPDAVTQGKVEGDSGTAAFASPTGKALPEAPASPLKPGASWLTEQASSTRELPTAPSTTSGKLPIITLPSTRPALFAPTLGDTSKQQIGLPLFSSQMPAVGVPGGQKPLQMPGLQTTDAAKRLQMPQSPMQQEERVKTSVPQNPSVLPASEPADRPRPEVVWKKEKETEPAKQSEKSLVPHKTNRRTVMVAASGVVAAGVVGIGGFSLLRLLQGTHTQTKSAGQNTGHAPTQAASQKMGNGAARNSAGKTIGDKNLVANSAQNFVNPADQKESILIHLPDNTFVAYERACTHEGVAVNYDAKTQKLVCPKHGAIFDPTNKAKVLQGPAQVPLRPVAIHVNADGTVMVG